MVEERMNTSDLSKLQFILFLVVIAPSLFLIIFPLLFLLCPSGTFLSYGQDLAPPTTTSITLLISGIVLFVIGVISEIKCGQGMKKNEQKKREQENLQREKERNQSELERIQREQENAKFRNLKEKGETAMASYNAEEAIEQYKNALNHASDINSAVKQEVQDKLSFCQNVVEIFQFFEISKKALINDLTMQLQLMRKELLDLIIKNRKWFPGFTIEGDYLIRS